MVGKAFAGLGGAAMGLLLTLRLVDGSYTALVQGWYQPVLVGTAGLLLALGLFAAVQAIRERGTLKPRLTPGTLAMIVLAGVPIVVGLAWEPKPLGSASLEALQDGGRSSLQFSSTAARSDPSQRNVYQWAFEFANTDPAEILGDPVDVMGFAYHAAEQPDGVFQVARFVVACCVADARGYMLPVMWNGADEISNDQWVHVVGRIATAPDGSLVILADTVELIESPANPYIYP